ncbi:hypothetical protein BD410DRAFT_806512 [Rickenella mellea]|uniref:Uncharacterized protein n=1 Tax=Rickenella mellea TaxID=50990 RepID=A0A4Y7PSW6_9AGAM|nr:hypothetical protein BD410DRAFT_806512 [Rickenella mellea]
MRGPCGCGCGELVDPKTERKHLRGEGPARTAAAVLNERAYLRGETDYQISAPFPRSRHNAPIGDVPTAAVPTQEPHVDIADDMDIDIAENEEPDNDPLASDRRRSSRLAETIAGRERWNRPSNLTADSESESDDEGDEENLGEEEALDDEVEREFWDRTEVELGQNGLTMGDLIGEAFEIEAHQNSAYPLIQLVSID